MNKAISFEFESKTVEQWNKLNRSYNLDANLTGDFEPRAREGVNDSLISNSTTSTSHEILWREIPAGIHICPEGDDHETTKLPIKR
jgi:hypothetical protein